MNLDYRLSYPSHYNKTVLTKQWNNIPNHHSEVSLMHYTQPASINSVFCAEGFILCLCSVPRELFWVSLVDCEVWVLAEHYHTGARYQI